MKATAEEKAALVAEHGKGKVFPVTINLPGAVDENDDDEGAIEFLIRAPNKAEYALFLGEVNDDEISIKKNAMKNLARPCIVWPSKEVMDAILRARPGVLESLANPITKLAGVIKAEAGKAL